MDTDAAVVVFAVVDSFYLGNVDVVFAAVNSFDAGVADVVAVVAVDVVAVDSVYAGVVDVHC